MALNKKHYKAIAEIINHRIMIDGFAMSQLVDVVEDMSELFEKDNPLFDKDRFFAACWKGIEEV